MNEQNDKKLFEEDDSLEEQMTEYMNTMAEDTEDDEAEPAIPEYSSYVSKEHRYNDHKSTGFTFIFVGILGMVFVVLNFLQILKILQQPSQNFVIYVVMTVFFLGFIVFGIMSYVKSHQLKSQVKEEQDFTTNLLADFDLTPEDIDGRCESHLTEEDLYFERFAAIRTELKSRHPGLDESFADEMTETIYSRLYE